MKNKPKPKITKQWVNKFTNLMKGEQLCKDRLEPTDKHWREEFDKLFQSGELTGWIKNGKKSKLHVYTPSYVKDFIKEIIQKEREKVIEELKLLEKEYQDTDFGSEDYEEFGLQVSEYLKNYLKKE